MKGDLPLFAMLQVPLLLLSILPARALATSYAYPSAPLGYLCQLVFRSLPWDLLFLDVFTFRVDEERLYVVFVLPRDTSALHAKHGIHDGSDFLRHPPDGQDDIAR